MRLSVSLFALCLFVSPLHAAPSDLSQMPDSDKWHIGETGPVAAAWFCQAPEGAAQMLALVDDAMDANGEYNPSDVTDGAAALSCEHLQGVNITFKGVVADSKIYVAHTGMRFAFVEVIIDGTSVFGYIRPERISDQPLAATPQSDPATQGGPKTCLPNCGT